MHIVIFTGGDCPDPSLAKKYFDNNKVDYVIACDSGVNTLEQFNLFYGGDFFVPDLILGDWDSIGDKHVLKKYSAAVREDFICDKDYSDTELALKKSRIMAKDAFITLVGAGSGKRIDHLFAVLDLFSTELRPDVWITGEQFVYLVKKESLYTVFDTGIDEPVSFFRLTSGRCYGRIDTEGLLWEGSLFRPEGYLSLSNRINPENADKGFSFKCIDGDFLLVTGCNVTVKCLS